MDAQILRELEIAAQILLAPPNVVSHQQREAAESVFLNFKKTKTPYILYKYILETSKVDYVLFEVAGLLKNAVIREWLYLEPSVITSLQQYLFQYVVDRSATMAPFVREKILQVISIIIKRESLDDNGARRGQWLNDIENLIANGDHSRRLLGCGLLASLIQEYSITEKSTDIGLTCEKNSEAKESFELTDLSRIFQCCCRALNGLANSEPSFPEESLPFVKQLLAISEAILTWNFTAHLNMRKSQVTFKQSSNYESNSNSVSRSSHVVKEPALNNEVVNLFFTVYWKIRSNPQLSHHALTCLVQLVSLTNTVFEKKESRQEYLTNYSERFILFITSVEILDREALGISTIFRKLILFFYPYLSTGTASPLLQSFLEQLTRLTYNFAEGAASEESMCADDRMYMEAFEIMSECWLDVLNNSSGPWKEYCAGALTQIFNIYMKCHLAPPEGCRRVGRDLEPEEFDESEETDRVKFKEQLQAIGEFGRHCLDHSLPLLAKLLEDRTKQLSSHFYRLHQQQTASISDSSSLVLIFEDLHWLLLIAGSVISRPGVMGKAPSIPFAVMNHSIAQTSSVSVEISLQVFGSPNRNLDEIQDAEQKTDQVIRLVSAVFRLSFLFKTFIEAKMMQFLSPEVISSTLWFLKQWAEVYLLLKEELNADLSMPFVCAFGRDSEGGVWAVNYLLEQVVLYILNFHSEPGVIQDTVNLFTCLVDDAVKGACVLKSENLRTIIMMQGNLPINVKRGVIKGLTIVSIAIKDTSGRNSYLEQILKPLQNRLQSLLSQENFNRVSHEEHFKTEVIDILESMIGVATGTLIINLPSVSPYLVPMLCELPTLMKVYYNYHQIVELILTALNNSVTFLSPCLHKYECKKLFEASFETIQVYAKCNSGRLTLDSDLQDDSFTDIIILMELLTNLITNNSIDFLEPEVEDEPLKVVDICLHGLNTIMPLVTFDLVKYPALCLQYFTLIKRVSALYPTRICKLPESLLKALLSSVEMGLRSFSEKIIPYCCDFIKCISWRIFRLSEKGEAPVQALKPFIKLLLDLILSGQLDSSFISITSDALFPLICCYQDEYRSAVQSLLNNQSDPAVKDHLAKAFNDLTDNISLKCEISEQGLFRVNFEKFFISVRGFFAVN